MSITASTQTSHSSPDHLRQAAHSLRVSPDKAIKLLSEGAAGAAILAGQLETPLELTRGSIYLPLNDRTRSEAYTQTTSDLFTLRASAWKQGEGAREAEREIDRQIAKAGKDFIAESANDCVQKLVALQRGLSQIEEVIKPLGLSRTEGMLTDLNQQIAERITQTKKSFATLRDLSDTELLSTRKVSDDVYYSKEAAWEGLNWEVPTLLTRVQAEAISKPALTALRALFGEEAEFYNYGPNRLREFAEIYNHPTLSPLAHKFVQLESHLRTCEHEPHKTLGTIDNWACGVVGVGASVCSDMGFPRSLVNAGPGNGGSSRLYSYLSGCRALSDFGQATNALFNRMGEPKGFLQGDLSENPILAERVACIKLLQREVFGTLVAEQEVRARIEDAPCPPLSCLMGFGAQGLSAALEIANDNREDTKFVEDFLSSVRAMSDARRPPGECQLDAVANAAPDSFAAQVKGQTKDFCMKLLASGNQDLRHCALWTVLHLHPEHEDVRAKVREIIGSEEGDEIRLVEQFQKVLEFPDEEIAAAKDRAYQAQLPK
jgi:hypothetical protein